MVKRIVCLANSRKLSGRCIAGKELLRDGPAEWIRPVSNREHEEVSEDERQYPNGSDPRVLDIIDVPLFSRRVTRPYQQENWLLDPRHYWRWIGYYEWENLPAILDPVGPLWLDGYHTHAGRNDRIPVQRASGLSASLRLIWVDDLVLVVYSPGAPVGAPKRRVQGRFSYDRREYWLRVTDPVYEREYLGRSNGIYEVGGCYLTISLGEEFNGYCYKLIAAVMED